MPRCGVGAGSGRGGNKNVNGFQSCNFNLYTSEPATVTIYVGEYVIGILSAHKWICTHHTTRQWVAMPPTHALVQ